MKLPLILHPEAQKEFDDAVDWYERQRTGLGKDFILRVHEVFERISRTPEIHGRAFMDVRLAQVSRFPYAVYYRIEPDRITVVSVFHAKRDPREWRRRV